MEEARTFTVLITETSESLTDDEAIAALRSNLQEACDAGILGGNFLITTVQDGDGNFWSQWNSALAREGK